MSPTRREEAVAVRIDPDTGWAWRGDDRLDLPPKAFAVLRHLIEHPEHLITKDELLAAAWGDTIVSEAALTSCIRDLRKALRDSSRTPRYIETVHRRGFRFIGPVGGATSSGARQPAMPSAAPCGPRLVGRDAELGRLHALLATALDGRRRVVFVTGEAGIGKTSLVETFLAQLPEADGLRIGRGQCVEQYGATEPYLPIFEAFGRLGREPQGDALLRVLKQCAPTWLAQLPALLDDAELEAVQRRAQGATRERMLRELVEAFDVLSTEAPLVLLLEDLHWSDAATIDVLAMLARRPDRARLLVVGTYRSADVAAAEHPLKPVKQELQLHGQCEELALDFLSEDAVREYLAQRFPDASFAPDFARVLRENTGGNPLFLVNVVDDLVAQQHVHEVEGAWALAVPVERVTAGVPRTLWQMVEKQLDRLGANEQAVLSVASVAGAEFSAALAAVDGAEAPDGERCCHELARRGQFIRPLGVAEWPDGTVAARYGFIHALYRDVLYARIPIGHRVGLHLRIGARLERAHGARAGEIAGELAMHFEQARDLERAVSYRCRAAETALRQQAHRQAVEHAKRALDLLATLPESPERDHQELVARTVLGAAVIATSGWAAPEVADTYARARDLCVQMGVTSQLFPVLLGLCAFYLMRGELGVAQEVSAQLLAVAETTGDAAALIGALNTAGMTCFYRGDFTAALGHLERSMALYDPEQHSPSRQGFFVVDHDPGVSCGAHTGMTLMMLGYQDRAEASMRACLRLARALDHPLSVAMGYNFAATFYQYRRAPEVVRELEHVRLEYSQKHAFDLFLMLGAIYRGWLLATQGHAEEGLAQIEHGLMVYQAIGAELGRPTFLGMQAEVLGDLGRRDEALAIVGQALDLAERTGLHYWDTELHRLRGMLLLRTAGDAGRASARAAESAFLEALRVAHWQEAKSAELRAATSLGRLLQSQGRVGEARKRLSDVYGWFTEGFDIPDLKDAKELLGQLERGARKRR
jgi:DNA-binding winged helix-turn-helix (wHTH) protein/predicted ATPase